MFVATDNLLPDAAAAEWLRKKFFGAKFVRRDLFSETFLFPSSPFAIPSPPSCERKNFYPVVNIKPGIYIYYILGYLYMYVQCTGKRRKVNLEITFDDEDYYWINRLIHRINISVRSVIISARRIYYVDGVLSLYSFVFFFRVCRILYPYYCINNLFILLIIIINVITI